MTSNETEPKELGRDRLRKHGDAAVALREIAEILERFDKHDQARECRRQANELAEYYEELSAPLIPISTDPPHEGKLVGEFHDRSKGVNELDPGRMTPQERHDRLQEAWTAICQIDAHMNQEGYEIDFDEKRLEASRAVGDVIEYYRRYEGGESETRTTDRYPEVEGECPECGCKTLFLGEGGYVTCSLIGCENPSAPSEALGVDLGRTEPEQ